MRKLVFVLVIFYSATSMFGQTDQPTHPGHDTRGAARSGPSGYGGEAAEQEVASITVEQNRESLAKTLRNTQRLVLVINDSEWKHYWLLAPFTESHERSLAAAILTSLEENQVEGPALRLEGTYLYVRYSSEAYQKSGQYLPKVVERLRKAAEQQEKENAEKRASELLGAAESESAEVQPDHTNSEESIAATLERLRPDLFLDREGGFAPGESESRSQRRQVERERVASMLTAAKIQSTDEYLRTAYQQAERGTDALAEMINEGEIAEEQLDLRTRLRSLVKTAFLLRLQLQQQQVETAQQALDASRKRLQRRLQFADQIIDQRTTELLTR